VNTRKYECKIIYKQNGECHPLGTVVTAKDKADAKAQAHEWYMAFVKESTKSIVNTPEGVDIGENIIDRLPVVKSIEVFPLPENPDE